ncbi:2526_t:CDS:2, partial [Gigaspora margarita]
LKKGDNLTKYCLYIKECTREKGVYNIYQEIIEGEFVSKNTTEDGDVNFTEDKDIDSTEREENVNSMNTKNSDSEIESEDLSFIEFNSIEIKERISKYPEMKTMARLICENIKKVNLCLNNLLSNGIVNIKYLRKYNRPLYDIIKKEQCFMELKFYFLENFEINLSQDDRKFINHHMEYGYSALHGTHDSKIFHNVLSSFLMQIEQIWISKFYEQETLNIT